MKTPGTFFLLLILFVSASFPLCADSNWDVWKSRFLMEDGRIVDTGNGSVSHSEGQGYGMLFAVNYSDRTSFNTMWSWTRGHLYNRSNGLFYWKYDPAAADPLVDKNNASDGDMLIAWALLKAGQKWYDPELIRASDNITRAVLQRMVISSAGYQVMLPGEKGFRFPGYDVINPSYFIFPAWQDFARSGHLMVWDELADNAQKLLHKMGWGNAHLPADWVALNRDGSMAPAPGWPPRASYDAIRIPLYIFWSDPGSALLTPWRNWWRQFSPDNTPAWASFSGQQDAPWSLSGGMLAVRTLLLQNTTDGTEITESDDYYSASLKLLVLMAAKKQAVH